MAVGRKIVEDFYAMNTVPEENKVRLDKWLWAARFFKTRSMASQAVNGGRVHLNGKRIKPARIISIGDELRIQRGEHEFVVIVEGLNDRRCPAKEACKLYHETEDSILSRQKNSEERRLLRTANGSGIAPAKRPSKRDRRLIRSFTGKD